MSRITRITCLFACTAALTLSAGPAWAQGDVDVTIAEGTNIAAAVSPNGQSIAIDALGRIWVMPMVGGTATPLTDPFGDARQPTWCPDASRIAFQAYWDGNYHICPASAW